MSLEFELYTTVDITNTRARKGADPDAYKQYQNYMTVLQTIGMRSNPTVDKDPKVIDNYPNFGNNKVWKFEFDIEYEGGHSIELLQNDFSLVPFISGLTETAQFSDNVFITEGKKQNIVFIQKE